MLAFVISYDAEKLWVGSDGTSAAQKPLGIIDAAKCTLGAW
jgi:hypothetical protein